MPARKPSAAAASGRLATRLPAAALDGHAAPMPEPVDAASVEEIFRRLQEANPEPKSDLRYTNPYTLLVAVVLSAQATDKGVNLATGPLSVG